MNQRMKKILLPIALLLSFQVFAQEDLLAELEKEQTEETPTPVYATFKSTRVINGHSVENIAAKHLDFRISHRFGNLNTGEYELFGLDQATLRLGFEYGINEDLMIGFGRTTVGKTLDGFVKYKILSQKKDDNGSPVTISYFGSTTLKTQKWEDPSRNNYFTSRLNFCNQLLIARKFNEHLSIQLTPTHIHKNLVELKKDPNDLFAMGMGGSVKITRSTRFNVEWFPMLNGNDGKVYANNFSVGFDIETGGHVFQLHFTNSVEQNEPQFITETTGKWDKGDIRFGFNISRTFSFDRSAKE
jgi:hypothetical protein